MCGLIFPIYKLLTRETLLCNTQSRKFNDYFTCSFAPSVSPYDISFDVISSSSCVYANDCLLTLRNNVRCLDIGWNWLIGSSNAVGRCWYSSRMHDVRAVALISTQAESKKTVPNILQTALSPPSVCPPVRPSVSTLYLLNRLTFGLDLLHVWIETEGHRLGLGLRSRRGRSDLDPRSMTVLWCSQLIFQFCFHCCNQKPIGHVEFDCQNCCYPHLSAYLF